MPFSAITDQISFIGRKKRQRDVFWDLAQNQSRFLYDVAFRYVGNRYDAEDLMQETLYSAYHKFHQLKDSRKFFRPFLEDGRAGIIDGRFGAGDPAESFFRTFTNR